MKLGHQAPKRWRNNTFQYIHLDGDYAYCYSHDFVYNPEEEERKLYNGEACHYTDTRFVDGFSNFFKSAYLFQERWGGISLKACIRRTLQCKNIPIGTIVDFQKSWYYPGKKINNSYKFKIRKENNLAIDYEINSPSYFKNFTTCKFSQELTEALRANGFIVSVKPNESFLLGMINTATAYTGKTDFVDSKIDGHVAVAYGHGKRIGFSSFEDDFMGYSNGCESVLWDTYGEFDKWSRCHEISKKSSIEEILDILKD